MKTFQEFITEGQHNSNESRVGSVSHYEAWSKDKGHLTHSSSSVLNDYSKDHSLSTPTHNSLVKAVFPQESDQRSLLRK